MTPDRRLSDLLVLGDFLGDEGFGEGLTGTHLWVNLLDAEGERFNFVNYSEFSLFLEDFTLDVVLGQGMVRIDPASIDAVPDGDRLLTEIVAFEVLIQDEDEPPTGFGKWFVDNLRIIEPSSVPGDADADGDVDLDDYGAFQTCFSGVDGPSAPGCHLFDFNADGDVDFADFATLQAAFTGG